MFMKVKGVYMDYKDVMILEMLLLGYKDDCKETKYWVPDPRRKTRDGLKEYLQEQSYEYITNMHESFMKSKGAI